MALSKRYQRAHPIREAFAYQLVRGLLDLLARLLDSCANIVNCIVDAAAGALHRPTRTATARDSQRQNQDRKNPFHRLTIHLTP